MKSKDKILLTILAITLIGFFFSLVSKILLPFVVSMIVAYFLDPATNKLEKFCSSRTIAVIIITTTFFFIVSLASVLALPLLYDQFVEITNHIPEYLKIVNIKVIPSIADLLNKIDPDAMQKAHDAISGASLYIFDFLEKIVQNILNSGLAIVNLLSLIFITPIVTFYFLKDWPILVKKVDTLIPHRYRKTVREQMKEIDITLSGYIRGQTQVALFLATFYSIGLTLIGLNFSFFIGITTGILSFVPYVGLLFGFVISAIVAFYQFGDIFHILLVASVFILAQIIDGAFLTPSIVGNKIGLHPVWIIFGLLAGGAIFGFTGVLVAVPITAIIGVLTRFLLGEYLKSSMYGEVKKKLKK